MLVKNPQNSHDFRITTRSTLRHGLMVVGSRPEISPACASGSAPGSRPRDGLRAAAGTLRSSGVGRSRHRQGYGGASTIGQPRAGLQCDMRWPLVSLDGGRFQVDVDVVSPHDDPARVSSAPGTDRRERGLRRGRVRRLRRRHGDRATHGERLPGREQLSHAGADCRRARNLHRRVACRARRARRRAGGDGRGRRIRSAATARRGSS